MMNCPATKPNTICRYEKLLVATIPGTDTKVTPEILEPIIAKATTYHVDFLFPTKKPALSAFLPAIYDIVNRIAK
jgi:hypothetical protein